MKIKRESVFTENSGTIKELTFSIDKDNESFIFEMLRNKIYKDPIGSICREIASNAKDANKENNKNVPIEISINNEQNKYASSVLLNNASQVLIISDSGMGISPNRMENVFIKYTSSTKRDTNKYIGGFGLGAKTPFSYTDIFVISTINNNIKYVYTAYIDESLVGKIVLQSQEKTTEESGTKIIIPIKRYDTLQFEKNLLFYTAFWKIKPIYKNFKYFDTNNLKKYINIIENKSTHILSDSTISYNEQNIFSSNAYLLIDDIPYELDSTRIILKKQTKIFSAHNLIKNAKIFIKFLNGSLSIAINRENVQYDNSTVEKITTKIQRILNEMKNEIELEIQKQPDILSACILYYKLNSSKDILNLKNNLCLSNLKNVEFNYKGLKIYNSLLLNTYKIEKYTISSNNELNKFTLSNKRISYYNSPNSVNFDMFKDLNIILDSKSLSSAKLIYKMKKENVNNAIIFRPVLYSSSNKPYGTTEKQYENEWNKIRKLDDKKLNDIIKPIKFTDIKIPRKTRIANKVVELKISHISGVKRNSTKLIVKKYTIKTEKNSSKIIQENPNDQVKYIYIKNDDNLRDLYIHGLKNLNAFKFLLFNKLLNIEKIEILLLKSNYIKRFNNLDSFDEYSKKLLHNLNANQKTIIEKYIITIYKAVFIKLVQSNGLDSIENFKFHDTFNLYKKDIVVFNDKLNNIGLNVLDLQRIECSYSSSCEELKIKSNYSNEKYYVLDDLPNFIKFLNIDFSFSLNNTKKLELVKLNLLELLNFNKKYPLIKHISKYYYNNISNELNNYIKLIDESLKKTIKTIKNVKEND